MGVRKYHSVDEMPGPRPRRPLDPDNLRLAFGLASLAHGLHPLHQEPGVRRFRTWNDFVLTRAARAGTRRPVAKGEALARELEEDRGER